LDELTDTSLGFAHLFIAEKPEEAVMTYRAGFPALSTRVGFILIAISGLCTIFNTPRYLKRAKIIGIIITLLGGISLVGYLVYIPSMFFYFDGYTTAMSFHASIMFLMYGIGLLVLSKNGLPVTGEPK